MNFGATRLIEDLDQLGSEAELIELPDSQKYVVIPEFIVESGKFMGRTIGLGILAPNDYPLTVAAAIQVKATPQLYETTDSLANVRNIQPSPLGTDWRYWSKSINLGDEKSTRRLISVINRIFDDA